MIKFDFVNYTKLFINENKLANGSQKLANLTPYFDKYKAFMGWYDVDKLFNHELIDKIKTTSKEIISNSEVFLVIGIGGSYLGSFGVIEALNSYFYNETKSPKIYFLGNSLSSEYLLELFDQIKDKKITVNVISKSGTTLEPSIIFDLVYDFMKQKYNTDELKKRIIVTTDAKDGMMRDLVNKEGYESFVIPNDIGGRYSVFTPVGLLPIAVSGIDIDNLFQGAKAATNDLTLAKNYAIIRDIMWQEGKQVEAYVAYEPKLSGILEWLKQLYSESLGKEGKGILPISFINTRDLHSLGQFVQEGNKILFETVINVTKSSKDILVPKYKKTLNEINNLASIGTTSAHYKGNVLNNVITIDEINAINIGYLLQFFMISCALNGFLQDVNPFNQDGVEAYKVEIKKLLD